MDSSRPGAGVILFDITNIQTVTFPIPRDASTKKQRFSVSVSDGVTTKVTRAVLLENDQSLRWNDTLGGFTVSSSSRLTLIVFEKHRFRNDRLLATFIVPYESLRSSGNEISVQCADDKLKKSPPREIVIRLSRPRASALTVTGDKQEVMNAGKNASVMAANIDSSAKDVRDKLESISDKLGFITTAVDSLAEVHPYAKLAWSTISLCRHTLERVQIDKDIVDLLDTMEEVLNLAPDAQTLTQHCNLSNKRKMLVLLMNQLIECGYFIQSYAKDRNSWKSLISGDLPVKGITRKYQETLMQLHSSFQEATATETRIFAVTESENENIISHDVDMKLSDLPYMNTRFRQENGCLPGTRVKLLDTIADWVNDPDPSYPKALILFGGSGTGKSSIAHEIAHRYNRMNRLTTSYFFVRGHPSCREPHLFFTTLARDLCQTSFGFKVALGKILHDKPMLVHVRDYMMLIESLLFEPLKDWRFVGPILVVIDALDEVEDAHGRSYSGGNAIPFHIALSRFVSKLPSNFRILITARPELDLVKAFPESSVVRCMYLDGALDDTARSDILLYMRSELHGIGEDVLLELTKKANGLFLWASVVCQYISNPPPGLSPNQCIQRIIHATDGRQPLDGPLDALYMTVLDRSNLDDPDIRNGFQSALEHVLFTFEPLSIKALNTMLQYGHTESDQIDISHIVQGMGSLLRNTQSDSMLPIAPLHTSFVDFLTDPFRSGKFCIDRDNAHGRLAYETLRTMQALLHFNICRLETSYRLNSEHEDLKERIEKYVPSVLSYSCRFWAKHLARVPQFDSDLFECLRSVMEKKFLFWLEVMSLMGELAVAITALLSVRRWLHQLHDNVQNDGTRYLDALVKDALAFVRYFAYPIAQSASHIYLSALPFTPSSSIIFKLYSAQFPYSLVLKRGRLLRWPPLVTSISIPGKWKVVCVAFSQNGQYVAIGLQYRGVYVWDTWTGVKVNEAMGMDVSSVAFSQDGRCLAYGMLHGRIRIWELQATAFGERKTVLKGHKASISALSFSVNDKQLISGSADHTVVIWDLKTGAVVAGPFHGHNNPVWAVSFLPDNEHVVSRSGFRTVRVWNVKTEHTVTSMKLFERMGIPTGTVNSAVHYGSFFFVDTSRVKSSFTASGTGAEEEDEDEYRPKEESTYWIAATAFSHDGKFIATSSCNKTHVWHATGELAGKFVGDPLNTGRVMCLAFSADGQQIASGSVDGIVSVWNIGLVDEDAIAKPEIPRSVAFAPDGGQIVVGRQDGTVEVLDVLTGQEVMIKDGNEENVWSMVAVSSNGNLIASAWKREVHIWTRTGEAVAGPITSSDNTRINALAFSDSSDLVAFGTVGGSVSLFDTKTGGRIAGPMKFCDYVVTLVLDGATPRVVVGTEDAMFVWDTLTDDVVGPFKHHRGQVKALALSVDGNHCISAADDYSLCLWNVSNQTIVRGAVTFGDEAKNFMYNKGGEPSSSHIALAQDGKKVAFAGKDHTILVFEVLGKDDNGAALQDPLTLAGHTDSVTGIALSRDGLLLASTSCDCTVRLWDLQAAAERKQALMCPASNDSQIANFDAVSIDNDGWAVYTRDGSPLRLMWIPKNHRDSLYRPSNVRVVGQQKETHLDLENIVHGQDWVKCMESPRLER